jgi:hypothetical protein
MVLLILKICKVLKQRQKPTGFPNFAGVLPLIDHFLIFKTSSKCVPSIYRPPFFKKILEMTFCNERYKRLGFHY